MLENGSPLFVDRAVYGRSTNLKTAKGKGGAGGEGVIDSQLI